MKDQNIHKANRRINIAAIIAMGLFLSFMFYAQIGVEYLGFPILSDLIITIWATVATLSAIYFLGGLFFLAGYKQENKRKTNGNIL